mmetsp:Transcript_73295/g.122387  ORF Transcript_73295/g.122387 Transcript_73295/m.122387 type:complete len:208 (+) Transcript_73295:638-1261(+)
MRSLRNHCVALLILPVGRLANAWSYKKVGPLSGRSHAILVHPQRNVMACVLNCLEGQHTLHASSCVTVECRGECLLYCSSSLEHYRLTIVRVILCWSWSHHRHAPNNRFALQFGLAFLSLAFFPFFRLLHLVVLNRVFLLLVILLGLHKCLLELLDVITLQRFHQVWVIALQFLPSCFIELLAQKIAVYLRIHSTTIGVAGSKIQRW